MSTALSSRNDQLDNDDGNNRVRVSKACSRCRARKDRCDGLKPTCSACLNAGQTCVYEASVKKRGLPEGYVRGLEKLLTLASNSIDGLDGILVDYLRNDDVQKSWVTSTGDELYTSWKESKVYHELEVFLQNHGATSAGAKRKRLSEDSGTHASPDCLDTLLSTLREQNLRIVGDRDGNTLRDFMPIQNQETGPLPTTVESSTSDLALPPNCKHLLDIYFNHVHCWFPVLDRPAILKTYYTRLRGNRVENKPQDGGFALLWAILAYAVIVDVDGSDRQDLSRQYSTAALEYIPNPYTNNGDVRDFDVMHAQALLVLALLRLGNGQWLGSWNCTGRAARIVVALGHDSELNLPSLRGVLQGCFIVETLLNVHFTNRDLLFPASLISHLMNEDGHEEWDAWQGDTQSMEPSFTLSIFNRLTRVFSILSSALQDNRSTTSSDYIQSQLEKVHRLAQEHFSAGLSSPTSRSPPHHVYFQIGLLFVQLRLVSSLSESDRTRFDLLSLARNVLGLFQICEDSQVGLARVPPLFADILILAAEVAGQACTEFAASPASPSYADFVSTITRFRAYLSKIWSSFREPDASPTTSDTSNSRLQIQSLEPRTQDFVANSVNLYDRPRSSAVQDSNVSTFSPFNQPPQLAQTISASQVPTNPFSNQSWTYSPTAMGKDPIPGNFGFFGTGLPATSPSFSQGDEVDAIFHEMAHLDTNEWTNERALGLRDFGFTDESAFMEFCNDPERLALPIENAGGGPLSSTRQSWAFTGQPR